MALSIHRPAFPLSQSVEYMWRVTRCAALPSRQRVYPDGAMALVLHLNQPSATYFIGDRTTCIRVPLLAGPFSRSFHFDPSEATAVIGVLFRPGAARMFFPVAAHELHNTDVALSELYPCEADRLLNEVCSAADEPAQFAAMERYLHRKLAKATPLHPTVSYAVKQLTRESAAPSVRSIQLETGLSHTRFIQLFREHVGLTPKLFRRVRRFHTLTERIEKGIEVNWAQLAADCGYFDQAHLIHDFRAFAGMTPLEYSRAESRRARSGH
jgi:AraC-like DNA-binding protein